MDVIAGENIAKGDLVQYDEGIFSETLKARKASLDINAEPCLLLGIAPKAILAGEKGVIQTYGIIGGLNLTGMGLSTGDTVFFNNGNISKTKMDKPNAQIRLGVVLKVGNSRCFIL